MAEPALEVLVRDLAREPRLLDRPLDVLAHAVQRLDVGVGRQAGEHLLELQARVRVRQASKHPRALVALGGEVERTTAELAELTTEAETAKRNLVAFRDEIARLRDERVRMLARLANATARLRLQEMLSGFSHDADIQALDGVREHIERSVEEARLTREVADEDLETAMATVLWIEASRAA